MTTGLVDSLLPATDAILSVRDSVGAINKLVYFVTRTYYQDAGLTTPAAAPEGYAKDTVTQLLPSPGMKQFSQDIRLREGGAIKAGDIVLKNISKNKFKLSDLDEMSSGPNVLKLYKIGTKFYNVINVTEKYVTFDVQVRELSAQTAY